MSWVEFWGSPKWVTYIVLLSLISIYGVPLVSASDHACSGDCIVPSQFSAEFSARLIWRRSGETSKAQLFVKGDRYRIEHLGGVKTDLGFASMTIVRLDKGKVWYVYAQRRLVLSVPATREDLLPFSVELNGEVSRTLIGDAVAGKRPAQLYEIKVLTTSGGHEKYYEWVDAERHVLLKLLSQERDWWVEYEHVVVSPQPDYFFESPLGYRKVEAQVVHPEK